MFHNVGRKAVRAAASVIVLGFLGSLAGCGGGGGGGDTTTPPPDNIPTLQSIEITPSLAKAAAGTTAQFTATGVYTDNSKEDLTAQATWASSDSGVAMVSNDAGSKGVAITTGVGSATVSATSGDVSGDTMLTVTDATLVSIEVTPAAPSIANGLTQQFTATGLYSDNSTQDLTTQVTWASSNAAVATVSDAAGSNGLATAAGAGSTTVSATSGGVTGDTTLTVTDATLVSIEVTPTDPSIADGTTQEFTATGVYTDDSTHDLTAEVTWASSNEAVATVSNAADSNGLATAVGAGSTTVSATSGGVTGDTTLTVTDATLVSIEVSPTDASIVNGLTQQFTATGVYTDASTQDLTTEVTWDSSDDEVATVSNADDSNGLATAVGGGSTTVSATSGDVTGDTTLTVTDATLVSIAVTPTDPSIADGTTQQFTATGLYTDASTQDLTTEVTWASSDDDGGDGEQRRRLEGPRDRGRPRQHHRVGDQRRVTGDTTLTVTDATLVSIAVTPADASIADGTTQQFTATGVYTDASTQDLTTEVTWASSNDDGGDGEQRRRLEGSRDRGRPRQHHRVGDQRRSDRRHDVDGDRRDPGVDCGDTGGRQHRRRYDSGVHGDRPLHGRLDAGPHDGGHLGLVRRRGGDGEQRRRLEGSRDRGRPRHRHRVGDQRRSDRRHDVDGDRRDPGVD